MAGNFQFSLVSPERELVSQEAELVVVPGSEGDFGVLAGHAPVISRLRPGIVDVHAGGDKPTRYFVYHGLAEVTATSLSVLAEEAVPLAELDATGIDQKIKDAEEDIAEAKDEFEKAHYQEVLSHLEAVKAVVG